MWKIRVFVGFYLRDVEDENRGDLLMLFDLSDKWGVVDQSEVSVEKEQIHFR